MPKARKRRTRSPHPGVVLLPPDLAGRHPSWRARYVDPDSGRTVKVTIDRLEAPTAETRRDWAIRKAKALARRRVELEVGALRTTGTAFDKAIERYFEDHPELRPATLGVYKAASAKLTAWAGKTGLRSADDVSRPWLVAFRAEIVRERRLVHVAGGKRGAVKTTTEPRSPHTVNRELRSVRTILGYLRKLGLLPRISTDDLRDGLERLPTGSEQIDYRKPSELQKLLDAALRHDAAMFAATRDELRGVRPVGSTSRYESIAPFVAAALLTGMRFGELVDLDWSQVDLDALDNEGRKVGEIRLTSATKTKRARTVGLEVSPALRKLLTALRMKTGGKGSVFGLTRGTATAAERRLGAEFGAPEGSGWQALRRTCGTFLTNAPGIFGAASAYRSAKQLGHSVAVAERHYVDVARGIPRNARTLEAAMQIETQLKSIIDATTTGAARSKRAAN
jgi:integrase